MTPSEENTLSELLARLGIAARPEQLCACLALLDHLEHWSGAFNLTAIHDRREALEKHIADSLTVLPWLDGVQTLLDAGSGAGFPALPIAIFRPDLRILSVDASQRKVYFQKEMRRTLGLKHVEPIAARLEDLSSRHPELLPVDAVVTRALGSTAMVAGATARLLRAGGHLLLMKSAQDNDTPPQVASGTLALETIARTSLPFSHVERHIAIYKNIKGNA